MIPLYLLTLFSLVIIDATWLFSMGSMYKQWIGGLFAPGINYIPIVLFYLVYAVAVIFFVISPAIKSSTPLLTVFLTGAFFGLIAYAAYDLTNQATLRDWPWIVTFLLIGRQSV